MATWKLPHLVKGALSTIPLLDGYRHRRGSTGGTDSARYCYSVWLRHLVNLLPHGMQIQGAVVGELGPGDSIGVGLAALLSGAVRYTGLDVVPFSARTDLKPMLEELVQLYKRREPIPDDTEFPSVRPKLKSYEFPAGLMNECDVDEKASQIRLELKGGLKSGLKGGQALDYRAPWMSFGEIDSDCLDLLISQAVLEYVSPLEEAYKAMFRWLKPGCYASHNIDLSAHYLSPFWNGHWAYTDWQWRVARGRREYFLNREPFSRHLHCATAAGFNVIKTNPHYGDGGLQTNDLSPKYRRLDIEDLKIRGAYIVLRKPAFARTWSHA